MTWQEGVGKLLERVDKDVESSFAKPAECFLKPTEGRVVVAQDTPVAPSKLIHVPKKYMARPTTGRVIATASGLEHWLNKRVVYGMMSGVALQFKNKPAWIVLSEPEIVAEITLEDAEIDQDAPLPLDPQYA